MPSTCVDEVASGQRFEFGDNWRRFLGVVDEQRIADAEASLKRMLEVPDLSGLRFLDAGSGSGLFSLAARRLGATVHSFDYDPESVRCTVEMKRRYAPDDSEWIIEQGSVLDHDYLATLGTFGAVYSWGVLHHTGAMWRGLANVARLVRDGGRLYISIYNDQGGASGRWASVKRIYCRSPLVLRWGLIAAVAGWWATRKILVTVIRMLVSVTRKQHARSVLPVSTNIATRGMSRLYDLRDWVGGYPFEVAKPETIVMFYRERGFVLTRLTTVGGGHGCNEYIFLKIPDFEFPPRVG